MQRQAIDKIVPYKTSYLNRVGFANDLLAHTVFRVSDDLPVHPRLLKNLELTLNEKRGLRRVWRKKGFFK